MVVLKEFYGDLFNHADNMAHCISSDLAMSKGIALTFRNKFGGIQELMKQNRSVGCAPFLVRNEKVIYYLITKEKYWLKPTIETLTLSLMNMRDHMIINNINSMSIPKLGCGLDGLKWDIVKETIITIFKNDNIIINVYSL